MSDTPEISRSTLRQATADLVNGLSREELGAFGISRLADLTGLDAIGLPTYSCVRALSATISIHSGKGLTRESARAGAIMEAIEFHVAELPVGPFKIASALQIPAEDRVELVDCAPCRSSIVNDCSLLAWEEVTNLNNGAKKLFPSDLIWMIPRVRNQPLIFFQVGSNGLASGGSLEDAILSALYEVLERDAWTLNQWLMDAHGIYPRRTPLIDLSPRIEGAVRRIEAAQGKLHLFDISTDYRVPAFWAVLLDLSGDVAGTFGGYGAHLDAEIAAIRAITEAAQARCCYISGARDDMFRRQFLLMKRTDQHKVDQMFTALELGAAIRDYRTVHFPNVRTELRYLLKLVKQFGVSEVFVKDLGSVLDGKVHVVRVYSPQCEPCKLDHWTPGLRCLSYAQRRIAELATPPATAPDLREEEEEGESWKHAT